MNKYCNTTKLLKGYNRINCILLDFEAEELKMDGLTKESEEVMEELRNRDFKTEVITLKDDITESIPIQHWSKDRDFLDWHKSMSRVYNDNNKWKYIVEVRNLTQEWINTIKFESKINHSNFIDNIIFTFRGCRRERRRYLIMFNNIINELIERLDSLDGGYKNNLDQQAERRTHTSSSHKVGFGR